MTPTDLFLHALSDDKRLSTILLGLAVFTLGLAVIHLYWLAMRCYKGNQLLRKEQADIWKRLATGKCIKPECPLHRPPTAPAKTPPQSTPPQVYHRDNGTMVVLEAGGH